MICCYCFRKMCRKKKNLAMNIVTAIDCLREWSKDILKGNQSFFFTYMILDLLSPLDMLLS